MTFTKGNHFGRGRIRGSKNHRTIVEQVLAENEETAIRGIVAQAIAGSPPAVAAVSRWLAPRRRWRFEPLKLPKVEAAADIAAACAWTAAALAAGEIEPAESQALIAAFEAQARSIAALEFNARLKALEAHARRAAAGGPGPIIVTAPPPAEPAAS